MNRGKPSTFVLVCLLAFALLQAWPVHAQTSPPASGSNRIVIAPDGHVEGTNKIQINGNVYTLTEDINGYLNNTFSELHGFIIILKRGIILDGAGHTIQGNGTGVCIYLRGMSNVTIKNLVIKGFTIGITTYILAPGDDYYSPSPAASVSPLSSMGTDNDQIINNTIDVVSPMGPFEDEGGWGIYLEFTNNMYVSGNTIKTQDPQKGVFVGSGFMGAVYVNTTFVNNHFVGCGVYAFHINEIYGSDNTVDGKPLVFLRGASNQVVDGAGQVFLYNCSNVIVKNTQPLADYFASVQLEQTTKTEITNSGGTIFLTNSSNNNTIHDNTARMIGLFLGSNFNEVFDNSLLEGSVIFARSSSDYEYSKTCIKMEGAAYNKVYRNILKISNNGIWLDGISLGSTQSNDVFNNTVEPTLGNSGTGITCSSATNDTIHANNITNCSTGISLSSSSLIDVFQNNITNCGTGIDIWQSSNNLFYNNNFLGNTQQVFEDHYMYMPPFYAYSTNNTWDCGSAIGGNYWSNYNGTDANGDGIGDTPYTVFENYTDRYPLMEPVVTEEFTQPQPTPSPTPTSSPTPTPSPLAIRSPTSSMPETPSPPISSTPELSTSPVLASSNPSPSSESQKTEVHEETIYALAVAAAIITVAVSVAEASRRRTK